MTTRHTPTTSGPRIIHLDGTVPPRPLEVGDTLQLGNGTTETITGAGASVLFTVTDTGRSRWHHRRPCEGDMSGVIVGIEAAQ